MRYRVEELAESCDVTVDTIRYYQSRGLLPPPEREGRLAWYGEEHVALLERIRALKEHGLSLALVARVLDGELDPGEQALALAITAPGDGNATDARTMTREQLAERTGVPTALLEALEREGLLAGAPEAAAPRYSSADVEAVRAGLTLLEAGVPLSELLDLARRHSAAMRETAAHAVELFARFVRDPIRGSVPSEDEAAQQMVAALHDMLPATGALVSYHFRRLVLEAARERLEAGGGAAVRDA